MGATYNTNTKTNTSHCNRTYSTQMKCLQTNLQDSQVATNNLMKIIDEDVTDVLCVQEPYVIHNKIVDIPRKHKTFASGREDTEQP